MRNQRPTPAPANSLQTNTPVTHPSVYLSRGMNPIAPEQQQSLVARLTDACGGSYSPETRRKYLHFRPAMGGGLPRPGAVPRADPRGRFLRRGDPRVRQNRHRLLVHARYRRDPDRSAGHGPAVGDCRPHPEERWPRTALQVLDGDHRNFPSRGVGRQPRRGSAGSARVCQFRVSQHRRYRASSWARGFAVYWPGSLGYYMQGAVEETRDAALVCRCR